MVGSVQTCIQEMLDACISCCDEHAVSCQVRIPKAFVEQSRSSPAKGSPTRKKQGIKAALQGTALCHASDEPARNTLFKKCFPHTLLVTAEHVNIFCICRQRRLCSQ